MKFDSELEVKFYDFLNDFELTSMISQIQGQVWVSQYRRVDFVITLTNGEVIYVEIDGPRHDEPEIVNKDFWKDRKAGECGLNTIRISHREFNLNKEMLANRIEGIIESLLQV